MQRMIWPSNRNVSDDEVIGMATDHYRSEIIRNMTDDKAIDNIVAVRVDMNVGQAVAYCHDVGIATFRA